jgi:hypothetical protein
MGLDKTRNLLLAQLQSYLDSGARRVKPHPRLGRLDNILKDPKGEFQPTEMVRAALLAPAVASLSAATQEQALEKAFETLLESCDTQDKADALAKSVLDNPSFPTSLKEAFLYSFLLDAYSNRQLVSFQTFEKLPLDQAFSRRQKDALDRIETFFKVDKTSSSALNT